MARKKLPISGPGAKPSRTSGIEKNASRLATMTSQQLASASAPPMQAPCTTAMVGFGVASISAHTSPMARLGLAALADRRARREVLAGAAQNDDAHGAVAAELLEAVGQRIEHLGVVAVGAVRTVERQGGDAATRDGFQQRVQWAHSAARCAGSVKSEKRPTWVISLPYFAASATARL